MKVVCEIPLGVSNIDQADFHWLKRKDNLLFVIENGKQLRMLSTELDPPKEVQTASLAESRYCTSLSWNRDHSLLAIVVDKRQVYFWEIKSNTFSQYRAHSGKNNNVAPKRSRPKEIELVAWSKLTEKLVICYSSGQMLLSRFDGSSNILERFIDNSGSMLKKISSIIVSDHVDLFACFSIISEVLVMTFDGQTKFYIQGDGLNLFNARFSFPSQDYGHGRQYQQQNVRNGYSRSKSLWLAYQSKSDGLFFKRISLDSEEIQDLNPKLNVLQDIGGLSSKLVDFHWLTATHLIACFSSGSICLIQVASQRSEKGDNRGTTTSGEDFSTSGLACEEIVRIRTLDDELNHEQSKGKAEDVDDDNDDDDGQKIADLIEPFKIFELVQNRSQAGGGGAKEFRQSFALAAATDYRLFYYELFEVAPNKFTFEQVDDLDLSASLMRVNLKLEQIRWSQDSSLLAIQLTGGHILVYRTRLTHYMLASYGPRTVYLSAPNEVTILDYGSVMNGESTNRSLSTDGGHQASSPEAKASENALILISELKPSVIGIGPNHLALALNNRVHFYSIQQVKANSSEDRKAVPYRGVEYVTTVSAISLCSKFVALLFDDDRLKLHAIVQIQSARVGSSPSEISGGLDQDEEQLAADDERFFPDPSKPEHITAFTLTEELLVYCTLECEINIFSLQSWRILQVCNHSKLFDSPIRQLRANENGNKFVCLLEPISDGSSMFGKNVQNVYLYDLYSNQALSMATCELSRRIFDRQIDETIKILPVELKSERLLRDDDREGDPSKRLERVMDAIWDTDGRTVLLVERKLIHVVAILEHTLEREEPVVEFAASAAKPSSYTTLYASQGIVSFQTSLGRVINSILETHDDELKLTKLERQCQSIRSRVVVGCSSEPEPVDPVLGERIKLEAQLEMTKLKLDYLRTVLPINSLPKCYEICEHLTSDEQFNLSFVESHSEATRSAARLIDQLIWRQLAAWSIYLLNLNYAQLIYRKHELWVHEHVLGLVQADLRTRGLDSSSAIRRRLMGLLDCEPSEEEMIKD